MHQTNIKGIKDFIHCVMEEMTEKRSPINVNVQTYLKKILTSLL